QLGSLVDVAVVGVVEDLRDRTPPRPAGQRGLLVRGGPACALVAAAVQDCEGVEVRSQLRGGAGRGEVLLTGGPKGSGPRRGDRRGRVYSGVLISWLISARFR